MVAISLYTFLKVKSRKGLGAVEWLWLKQSKKPPLDIYTSTLSELRRGKFIEEEPWKTDGQGREIIPSLPDKKFFLTGKGEKELKRVKGLYLWCQACKYTLLLIRGLFYAVSLAASLYGLIELYGWCIEWL